MTARSSNSANTGPKPRPSKPWGCRSKTLTPSPEDFFLLACAPGERHELGLIVFGLALRRHGSGITYLGADTPIDTLAAAVGQLELAAVVVVALTAERRDPIRDPLAQLADGTRLLLAGTGADEKFAATIGAELLDIRSLLLQS